MGKFFLTAVAVTGWCWGVFSYRVLRRTRRSLARVETDKREVERLSDNRSKFINYLAHETRTLLHSLHGGLRLAREDSRRFPLPQMLGLVEAMTVELQALVSMTLDRAHIDSGKLQPDFAVVDLQVLAEQVVGEFRFMARHEGLHLLAATPDGPRHGLTDAVRLRQCCAT